MCVCVCVCVKEREREREGGKQATYLNENDVDCGGGYGLQVLSRGGQ